MNDEEVNQAPSRPDRRGTNNPFYGHRHTEQSREKMRQAAAERNKKYQQLKNSQQVSPMSMGECLSTLPVKVSLVKIIREEIQKLLYDTRL